MEQNLVGTAYAIYSETDKSLTFIRATEAPQRGQILNGKVITEVYTGFETEIYYNYYKVPWSLQRDHILKVVVRDSIRPISTSMWFNGFTKCTEMNLAKLDTSKVKHMDYMFGQCTSLKSVDLRHFDMNNVKSNSGMFFRTNLFN